jgi:hypothetical protein
MTLRFLTILTVRNLPKIRQPGEPEQSIIDEKTIADFTCASLGELSWSSVTRCRIE